MMNQEYLFKKIGNILTELQDQYQYLAENPQKINELELELFLSNANFLTDHIHIVIKSNNLHEVKSIAPEKIYKPEKEPATLGILNNGPQNQEKFEFEEKEVNSLFNRPLTAEEQQIIAQKQAVKNDVETIKKVHQEEEVEPEPSLVPEQQEFIKEETLAVEIVKEEPLVITPIAAVVVNVEPAPIESPVSEVAEKLTLNELLAGKKTANGNTESTRVEIKDLKKAISLNDKLMFVKDLFHGYNLAYAEVIELLNKMPDLNTADKFLQQNYALKNDWKSKQDTVDRFYDLLNRRFPVK
ncbi:hypothetical protein AAKU52_000242 [Pedobacter sp. CG_S7]|uniref:hypothetical protein n=1 Tax=Pedobacter sp. CG_S7 TaxID=3143930 RepID=UPI003395FBF2